MVSRRQKIIETLKICPLFSGLEAQDLRLVSRLCEIKILPKGKILFSEGNLANHFFVVISGRMRVYKMSLSGREQTLVTPGPGISFAEAALFVDQKYPAYCQSIEDSEIISIDKLQFIGLIKSRPQIALNMIAQMSERLRGFTRKIEQLSLMGVVSRLAQYIIQKADIRGELTLDISKSDLATLLGTVPETLSRALAKLKARGLIKETGSKILINNLRSLENIADEKSISQT